MFSLLLSLLFLSALTLFFRLLSSDFCHYLHQQCLAFVPSTAYSSLNQALLCGEKLGNSPYRQHFANLGIIHLFVASGFHLHFLGLILNQSFFQRIYLRHVPHIVSALFLLTGQVQMALLRAYLNLLLARLNQHFSLHYSAAAILLFTSLICILSEPSAYQSLSLPLSWTACLGLQFGRKSITRGLFCFICLIPLIALMGPIQPLSFALTYLISPIIGFIFLPSTLVLALVPLFEPFNTFTWAIFMKLLLWAEAVLPNSIWISTHLSQLTIWLYPMTLNLYLLSRHHRTVNKP